MAQRTIRLYLLLTLLTKLGGSFISATYVMFLISRGLNLFEVNLVNLIFFTTLFLSEIPTGAAADVFGRKTSFVISCFLYSAGMFIYAISYSFWGFALAEAAAAIGATFASGAFQAWLVDQLQYQNYKMPLGSVFAKEQQVTHAAGILGAVAGAYLADRNTLLPWMTGGVIMFIAGILALVLIKEEYFVRQNFHLKTSLQSMKDTIKTSIRYGIKSKAVKFILVMGTLQYFAVQAPNMQWQPFFSRFLSDKTSLGFVFAAISVCLMAGSLLSSRFLKLMRHETRALAISQIGIGIGIAATALLASFPFALGLFLFQEIARGLFRPLKDMYLNENIPSKERATLISFESMSHHAGGLIGLLFSGFFAEHTSIEATWVLSGIILVGTTLWLIKKK
ncbi:MFS transporter [Candidatus Jorgensenbacteria bacterium]|nr:MFS transporter [Candidatus Jorgensenbacteria bacterium]